MAPTGLLDMPREVRDIIYVYYVTIDGGYVFNPETCKLMAAVPCKGHLALQRTCKLIAAETDGLALSQNVVTFSTFEMQEKLREKAAMWHFLGRVFDSYHKWHLTGFIKNHAIPNAIQDHIARHFPQFLPLLHAIKRQRSNIWSYKGLTVTPTDQIGLTPSLHREFVHSLLECLSIADPTTLRLALHRENWCFPSDDRLQEVIRDLRPGLAPWETWENDGCGPFKEFDGIHPRDNKRYHFSAATASIRFLQSNPRARLHLRKIILDEDRRAILHPASHAKGLIPFCAENPRLRIERRVNMWTNIIATWLKFRRRLDGHSSSSSMSEIVADWILEALALPPSISLVLDGNPAPEICSELFQKVLIQDAIWQSCLQKSLDRQLLHLEDICEWQLRWGGYICDNFPRLIQNTINITSPVSCNFYTGHFCDTDIETLIDEHQGWTMREWHDAWGRLGPDMSQFSPPFEWYALATQEYVWLEDDKVYL